MRTNMSVEKSGVKRRRTQKKRAQTKQDFFSTYSECLANGKVPAVRFRTVDRLIRNGLDVNVRNEYGIAPVHIASYQCDLKVMELLILSGADVNSIDCCLNTPLHAVCQALIESINAADSEEPKLKRPRCSSNASSVLLSAIEMLLKYGANCNLRNIYGLTPVEMFSPGLRKIHIELFVKWGYDIHTKDFNGRTLMHHVVQHNARSAFEALLDLGCDPNQISDDGETPLFSAAKDGRFEHMVDSLMVYLRNPEHISNKGQYPMHLAIHNRLPVMIGALAKYGCDVDCKNNEGDTPLFEIIKHITSSNSLATSRTSNNPLEYNDIMKIFKLRQLLKWGANINSINSKGLSVLEIESDHAIHNLLVGHALRLNVAGFYVSKKNMLHVCNFSQRNSHNAYMMVKYIMLCTSEMEKLKSTVILKNVTYYKILKKSTDYLAFFANTKQIKNLFKNQAYLKEFPIYGDLIDAAFAKAMCRKSFLAKSEPKIYKLLNNHRLPDNVVRNIQSYLPNYCLHQVAQV